jgi:hypothetical protein
MVSAGVAVIMGKLSKGEAALAAKKQKQEEEFVEERKERSAFYQAENTMRRAAWQALRYREEAAASEEAHGLLMQRQCVAAGFSPLADNFHVQDGLLTAEQAAIKKRTLDELGRDKQAYRARYAGESALFPLSPKPAPPPAPKPAVPPAAEKGTVVNATVIEATARPAIVVVDAKVAFQRAAQAAAAKRVASQKAKVAEAAAAAEEEAEAPAAPAAPAAPVLPGPITRRTTSLILGNCTFSHRSLG